MENWPLIKEIFNGLHTFNNEKIEFIDQWWAWLAIFATLCLIVVRLIHKAYRIKKGRRQFSNYWVYSGLYSNDPAVKKIFRSGWLYHIPKLLILLVLIPLIIAVANPVMVKKDTTEKEEARQIKFQVDFSGSMGSLMSLDSPISQIKDILLKILEKKENSNDRYSLDVFSDKVHVISGFTSDKRSLRFTLENLSLSEYRESGTRIDLAVEAATYFFKKEGDKKIHRNIDIILSDADSNNDPTEAILKAKKAGVHIYLIGIGATRGNSLKMIDTVQKAGGIYIKAEDADSVQNAIMQINRIEKSSVNKSSSIFNIPLFEPFALIAYIICAVFLVVAMSPFFRDFP